MSNTIIAIWTFFSFAFLLGLAFAMAGLAVVSYGRAREAFAASAQAPATPVAPERPQRIAA